MVRSLIFLLLVSLSYNAQAREITAPERHKLVQDANGVWKTTCAVRGLGLGAWFAPERWMIVHGDEHSKAFHVTNGTIYHRSKSQDFCSLTKEVGREEMDRRFKEHLATFITEKDFAFMAEHGVNVLRLAVGYWNVVEDPYKMYAPIDPEDSLKVLDDAFVWAKKHNLDIILDLHGSPGSQNGWEHSGCGSRGAQLWSGPRAKKNQDLTVEVMRTLAKRYGSHPNLLALQVANEPVGFNHKALMDMYKNSYHAIREHTQDVWVVIYGEEGMINSEMFSSPDYHNVVLDTHKYTCLGDGRPSNTQGHRLKAQQWKKSLAANSKKGPIMIGEWSLCHNGPFELSLKQWAAEQQKAWKDSTIGSVFWSYKLARGWADFDFRVLVEKHKLDLMAMAPRCEGEANLIESEDNGDKEDLEKDEETEKANSGLKVKRIRKK